MYRSKTQSSVIAIILISLFLFTSLPRTAHASTPRTPLVYVYSSDYGSSNVTDTTNLVPGQTFNMQVDVQNAPITGWNGFEFALYYDPQYINLTSYDLATNTVFSSTYVSPSSYDGVHGADAGQLRLSVVCLSCSQTIAPSNGTLVNLVFTVLGRGVSPLTLAAAMTKTGVKAGPSPGVCPDCPTSTPNWTHLLAGNEIVSVNTQDGYFSNQGNLGPVSSFRYTWNNATSPKYPAQGQPITFNATTSYDPDNSNALNRGIKAYLWDFGIATTNGNETTLSPVVTHTFSFAAANTSAVSGNFSIRLTVIDFDNNFEGMSTQLLSISSPPSHCIQVSAIFVKSQVSLGSVEGVGVQLTDAGTYNEHFNLTVTYNPQNGTLPPVINSSLEVGKVTSYSFNITTTSLVSTVYVITAKVTLYGNRTVPIFPNCPQGTFTTPFQIVGNGSGSALLVILEAVVVLVAVIAVVSVLMRRRRKPEPP